MPPASSASEGIRQCGLAGTCRFYQASTSALRQGRGSAPERAPPSIPYSPYAVAKLYGFWIVKEYREAYNMFACSGILFNHESERRETFVTRKITLAAARIAQGSRRNSTSATSFQSPSDWGYARDYVSACGSSGSRSPRTSSSPPASSTPCASSASTSAAAASSYVSKARARTRKASTSRPARSLSRYRTTSTVPPTSSISGAIRPRPASAFGRSLQKDNIQNSSSTSWSTPTWPRLP